MSKIIMTTSVTRPCFTTQHQTCKTKTKTKNDFLVSDRSCPRPMVSETHHWYMSIKDIPIVEIMRICVQGMK